MPPRNTRNNQNNNDGNGEGNLRKNKPACAACKKQRKGCAQTCLLAPYFPHTMTQEFNAVHDLFGLSNVQRMLRNHQEHERRQEFVNSLIWNADMWKDDSVLGPYGAYLKLQRERDMLASMMQSQLEQQQQQQYQQQYQQQQQVAIAFGHINIVPQQNINHLEGSWRYTEGIFRQEPRAFRGGEETGHVAAATYQMNLRSDDRANLHH